MDREQFIQQEAATLAAFNRQRAERIGLTPSGAFEEALEHTPEEGRAYVASQARVAGVSQDENLFDDVVTATKAELQ
jgi:hypothetical protein